VRAAIARFGGGVLFGSQKVELEAAAPASAGAAKPKCDAAVSFPLPRAHVAHEHNAPLLRDICADGERRETQCAAKRAQIENQMKQLRDQINGDFSNMIDFGNKVRLPDFSPAHRTLACNYDIALAPSAHHPAFCGWAGCARAEGRVYHSEGEGRVLSVSSG
jgi:hypothetical protein